MTLRWIQIEICPKNWKNVARPTTEIVADEFFDWNFLSFENFKSLQVKKLYSRCRFDDIIQQDTYLYTLVLKVAFFRKCDVFFKSPNLQKKYSKSLSWTWNLNFPPIRVNNKFKLQAQDSNLEYFDLEILKRNRTFWIKATALPHDMVILSYFLIFWTI